MPVDIAARSMASEAVAQFLLEMETREKLNILQKTIAFPSGKGLVSIRFDDNDATFFTNALPLLKARALPCTLAFVANKIGAYPERAKCTDANARAICESGAELANHSYTHGDTTPTTSADINREVVLSKHILETNIGFAVNNYVKPGSWTTMPSKDDELGKTIMRTHAFYEGYDEPWERIRPNFKRFGMTHETFDVTTVAQLQAWVDRVCGQNLSLTILFHSVGLDGVGVTTADFTTFLDYLVTKRNAGLIEVVTNTAIWSAQIGTPINYAYNGGVELLGSDGVPVFWGKVGTPSITTTNPHGGSNAMVCTNTSYYKYTLMHENLNSPVFRIKVWHRTDTTGTARLLLLKSADGDATGTFTTTNKTATSNGTWQALEMTVGLPMGLNKLDIRLNPSAGTVVYDDFEITRIG